MKKKLVLPLFALTVAALTGCGGASGGGSTGVVKIRIDSQYGKGFQEQFQTLADEFNNSHKDIQVEVNQISGGYAGVLTAEKADLDVNNDQWGDLVCAYPDHVADYLSYRGKVVKLDKFIDSTDPEISMSAEVLDLTDPALTNLNAPYPATGRYTVPYSISTEALFYNPIILGQTIPGVNGGNAIDKEYIENLTWEEFFDNFCPKLLAWDHVDDILDRSDDWCILGYDEDGNAFITLCEQYGYGYTHLDENHNPVLDFNNDNVKNLLKKWNGYKNKHYVYTQKTFKNRTSSELFPLTPKAKCLFCIGSTGGLSYHKPDKFEIRMAKIPYAAGHERKQILQGGSFCILAHNTPDNEARQLAAWKFYKYLINETNSAYWSTSTGYAPIKKSVLNGEAWAEVANLPAYEGTPSKSNLYARNAQYLTGVNDILFTSAIFKGSASARKYCEGLIGEVLMATTSECTDAFLKDKFDDCENNIRNDM